jgi:hypothetical protein
VTPEERQLLETTARSVLKLKEDIFDRVSGIEAVLHALFLARTNRYSIGSASRDG